MKLEADYIKQFEDMEEELKNIVSTPLSKEASDKLNLMLDAIESEKAQYIKRKNQSLWDTWTEIFYPFFCEVAEIQGGRVSIEIDEDNLVGHLKYYGHDLLFTDVSCDDLKILSTMLTMIDNFSISSKDGMLALDFAFQVYDDVKIADYSDNIESILEKIFSPTYRKLKEKK